MKSRSAWQKLLDIIILVLVGIGLYMTVTYRSSYMEFQMRGAMSLRYYTVQSNLLAGIVALLALFHMGKATSFLKLISASATGLTFLVVACFLGPIYGHWRMYKNANLFFHLIVPLLSMLDYIFLQDGLREWKWKIFAVIPTVVYGFGYILNILINGKGGRYPKNNDFYMFLRWGWGPAIGIFVSIVLASFGIVSLLSFLNKKVS